MEIRLKRKLGVAAILLGACLTIAGLTMLGGCTTQIYKFDINAAKGQSDGAEAVVNADDPEGVWAKGTVSILFNRSCNPEHAPLVSGNPL